MIELLKNDDIINKVGGRFKLTALMQRRWVELMQGARPTVDPTGKTPLEVIAEEIMEGKIEAVFPTPADADKDESGEPES